MKRFRKYLPFFRASLMQMFIYRGTVVLWLLVDVFQFFMMVYLWKSVYEFQTDINGFMFNEMLVYYLLTNLFMVFTQGEALYSVSEEVRQGRISLYLVKPISYKIRLFWDTLGRAIGIILILLPIVFLTGLVITFLFDITWTISLVQILAALLYVPLIFTFMFEFSFLFGTLSIHTTNVFGISIFVGVLTQVMSGQLIPLALYPPFLQNIILYTPFRFLSYPALILLDKVPLNQIWQGLLILSGWVLLFEGISSIVFRLSMKKIVVFGG